ncbi:MAG: hypothetical protein ABI091_18750, partial [Ferruginibacter sp.]
MKNFIGLFFLIGTVGCFQHYYKAIQPKAVTASDKASVIDSLNIQSRYLVLRSGSQAYYIKNISLNADKAVFLCTLDTLPSYHELYLTKGRNGRLRYKPRVDLPLLSEVHIFITPDTSVTTGSYVLQLSKIQKIAIIEKDKARTTTSFILSGLGIVAGVVFVVGAIAASGLRDIDIPVPSVPGNGYCSPQVYTVSNKESALNGTLCSGAIYASLERRDYLPVNTIEKNSGKLNLILKGEKNEELMMKDFQLIQVTHDAGQKILIDKNGRVLPYEHAVTPEHAFIGAGKDVVNDITAPDGKYYSFTNNTESGSSNVVLDFKKPLAASSGRLIIRGKNSEWAYYVFNEFKKLYGRYYHSLILKKDDENPAKVLQCEIDQSLPLLVSVKDGKGWKLVD